MSARPNTQLTITQESTQNLGQMIGVNTGKIKARDISFTTYLGTRPDISFDPPPAATVNAYLKAACEKQDPPKGASTEEAEIWEIKFRAHKAGEEKPHDLYDIFSRISFENEEHGGFQRLVLLADAGMGKTPALYYLREKTATESLRHAEALNDKGPSNSRECIIPLFIRLEDLDGAHLIIDLVRDAFNSLIATERINRVRVDQAQGLLQKYICLLLFDDLGELLSRGKIGGFQLLSHFMEVYREHQFVISCCTSWYREQLGTLDILFLDNLTKQQAERILGEEAYRTLDSTAQGLARNRGILAEYIRLDRPSDLLRSKGRLLEIQVSKKFNKYFHDPEPNDAQPICEIEILEGLLEELAFNMRIDHTHTYSDQQMMDVISVFLQNWKETIHWRKLAHELHNNLGFLKHDSERRSWRFDDVAIEAYFASSAILHNAKLLTMIFRKIDDYWWRDVFEVLVGLHPEPRTLLLELIDRNVFVAANSIRYVEEVGVEDALIDALGEQMKLESSARRKYIVERIGESDLDCAVEALVRTVHREWSSMVVMAAVKALINWQKRTGKVIEKAEQTVLHSMCGSNQSISDVLKLFPRDERPGNTQELLSIFKSPASPQKNRGLAAIGLGFVGTREVLNSLFEMLIDEQADDFVAWRSVEALTQTRDSEICKRAIVKVKEKETDIFSHARARAVCLLGWMGRGAKADNLLHRAVRDRNYLVRGYAIDAMARLDLLHAREKIEEILSMDTEEPFVHRKAAEELGQIGTLESLPVLEKCLLKEQARTRWAIRQAISEISLLNGLPLQ